MRIVASGFVALALAGCAHVASPEANPAAYEARALPPAELQRVRDQVREYARAHCGKCHIGSLPTARPAALRIYNLDADNWSSTLSAAQLRNGFPRRLDGKLDGTGKQALRAFIEAELALR